MQLIDYLPRYLKELAEIRAIMSAEQPEFDWSHTELQRIPQDFFLLTLSEYGCSRWEKIMNLQVQPSDTLQQRRDRIWIKYTNNLPYTWRGLLRYLDNTTLAHTTTLNANAYALHVRATLESYAARDALMAELRQIIPANLTLNMQVVIPQPVAPSKPVAVSAVATIIRHKYTPLGV